MGWSKAQLVQAANDYALNVLGCPQIPGILKKTVGMMGLKGIPGLNIVSQLDDGEGRGGGGRGGRSGGGRSGGGGLQGRGGGGRGRGGRF